MDERMTNDETELCVPVSIEEEGGGNRFTSAVKGFFSKVGARSVVVAGSFLLIGTAVVLNFVLFGNSSPTIGDGDLLGDFSDDDSYVSEGYENDTYFASAQLSRQQARDQAIAVLQTVVASSVDELSCEQANADISRIASEIQTEASIETLIRSKGFEDCVAVISEGNASVIVRSDGLLANELSQIKEIVWEQAGIDPVNIKIIEKAST